MLLALLLHLLILGLVGSCQESDAIPTHRLKLRLVPLPPGRIAERPEARMDVDASGRNAEQRIQMNSGDLSPAFVSAEAEPTLETPRTVEFAAAQRSHHGSTELIDAARKAVRDMVRNQGGREPRPGLEEDRPFLAALDRALRKPSPGEKRYADGLIRVTTESGKDYCLKPPPDFARGGPVELLAVPTNCP
ncbi:MAG: hypothetical protein WCV99_24595 [Sterolibacterium sp.]